MSHYETFIICNSGSYNNHERISSKLWVAQWISGVTNYFVWVYISMYFICWIRVSRKSFLQVENVVATEKVCEALVSTVRTLISFNSANLYDFNNRTGIEHKKWRAVWEICLLLCEYCKYLQLFMLDFLYVVLFNKELPSILLSIFRYLNQCHLFF